MTLQNIVFAITAVLFDGYIQNFKTITLVTREWFVLILVILAVPITKQEVFRYQKWLTDFDHSKLPLGCHSLS